MTSALEPYFKNRWATATSYRCSWRGPCADASVEAFGEMFTVHCPSCDTRLVGVNYPTETEIVQDAGDGDAEALDRPRR